MELDALHTGSPATEGAEDGFSRRKLDLDWPGRGPDADRNAVDRKSPFFASRVEVHHDDHETQTTLSIFARGSQTWYPTMLLRLSDRDAEQLAQAILEKTSHSEGCAERTQ